MKATKQLKEEHQGVLLMLQILEKVVAKLARGENINPAHLTQILEFLTVFVDKCHHTKEEILLFPALEEVGIPNEGGPVGMMLLEHNEGRKYIQGMKEAASLYQQGDTKEGKLFSDNAKKYIGLLREHIDKEDNILYMIADMHLDEKKQKQLANEFEKIEAEEIGLDKHEQLHQMLDALRTGYLS